MRRSDSQILTQTNTTQDELRRADEARSKLVFRSEEDREFCRSWCMGGKDPGGPMCQGIGSGGPCDRLVRGLP